jgi:peptidoglycan/LPS O-acetylase OafA/YrhL
VPKAEYVSGEVLSQGSVLTLVLRSDIRRAGHLMITPDNKTLRIPALDFTKGALVLFMVLYHWLNYFIATEGDFYRYLRFVTPSFIFISGFLISNVYTSKYDTCDLQLPKRLMSRGFKILGLFIFLNVTISFLVSDSYHGRIIFDLLSSRSLTSIFVTGNIYFEGTGKADSFHILVPISYLLLMSAGFSIVYRFYRYIFHVACIVFLLCIFILNLSGFETGNLELLTIGLLGVVFGYVPIDKINNIVKYPYVIMFVYMCYLGTITAWGVDYPLLIVGVCLSLMLLYVMGGKNVELGRLQRHIILLGRYSLFGYISQIAVLQLLYRSLRHINLGAGTLVISFLGAFALTIITVQALDRTRTKLTTVDRVYKACFS